jgi:DnaJ family protein A protein 2
MLTPTASTNYSVMLLFDSEVTKTTSCEEIRRAFRRKALKAHPDKGGDPEKFKQLSEANEILSNPEKRDLYDKYGMEGVKAGGNPSASGFEDIFSFFGGGRARDTGPKKAKPKLIPLEISL